MRLMRLIVIFLSFVMDVRVRAGTLDWIQIVKQAGDVDVEMDHSQLDAETFKGGSLKLNFQESKIGMASDSFISFEKHKVVFHLGHVFLNTYLSPISVSSRHGLFKVLPKTTAILEESPHKTTVSVLSGGIEISTRVDSTKKVVREGYSAWIGGLLSNGTKVESGLNPIDFERSLFDLREFGGLSGETLKTASDRLELRWKKAVAEVSLQDQDQINGEIKLFDEWKGLKKKRELASVKEHQRLKKVFKAHALDLPYGSGESP